jgi:hypothetical protein
MGTQKILIYIYIYICGTGTIPPFKDPGIHMEFSKSDLSGGWGTATETDPDVFLGHSWRKWTPMTQDLRSFTYRISQVGSKMMTEMAESGRDDQRTYVEDEFEAEKNASSNQTWQWKMAQFMDNFPIYMSIYNLYIIIWVKQE